MRFSLVIIFTIFLTLLGGCNQDYHVSSIDNNDAEYAEENRFETDPVDTPVDVLILLDTSCSMENDVGSISNILDIPEDLAWESGVHWRLGIRTMNVERSDLVAEIDLRRDPELQLEQFIDDNLLYDSSEEQALDSIFATWEETTFFRGVYTIFVIVTDESDKGEINYDTFIDEWPTEFEMVSVTAVDAWSTKHCNAFKPNTIYDLSVRNIDICDDEPWSIF